MNRCGALFEAPIEPRCFVISRSSVQVRLPAPFFLAFFASFASRVCTSGVVESQAESQSWPTGVRLPSMTKKRKLTRPETMHRNINFSTARQSMRVGVDEPRDPEPEIEVKPWIELRGTLDEPVRQASSIVLNIYPDSRTRVGTARPPLGPSLELAPPSKR